MWNIIKGLSEVLVEISVLEMLKKCNKEIAHAEFESKKMSQEYFIP